jgi:hypothetical protein
VRDPRVQDLVRLHHQVTSLFWTPNREAYKGLGQLYLDDERFRQNVGAGDDSLVQYLHEAMTVYADTHLSD